MTGQVRALATFYVVMMKNSAVVCFHYRARAFILLLITACEAVVYLALWTTVAASSPAGTVGGWSSSGLAAYFIVLTLVRQMTTTSSPQGIAERVHSGQFSVALLRPMHPMHGDIAEFMGWKLVLAGLWLPVAVALTVVFRPSFDFGLLEVAVFVAAIWMAFLIRTLYLWLLGMIAFWLTRAIAAFDLFMAVELLFSGRLMPLSLLPDWAAAASSALPFRWVFGFPVEVLVAGPRPAELLHGLMMQAVWVVLCGAGVLVLWRGAIRRYTAVGH
jgi:ABC-2 type transport system permease protein